MRYVAVIGFCVFAAACTNSVPTSPVSPSSSIAGAASTDARGSSRLPFRGTLEAQETITGTAPVFHDELKGTGQATHLGRFTATFSYDIQYETLTSSGTFLLEAANGDSISGSLTGSGTPSADGLSIVEEAIITEGTGRLCQRGGNIYDRATARLRHIQELRYLSGTIDLGH